MEHHNKVIQSLDSMWFYTNLFSSSTTKPSTIVSDDYVIIKSDPSKPTTPIQQTQISIDSIVLENCPKSRDCVSERNRESKETGEEREKKERRIRKKKRSKGNYDQRRKVVNWLDFGFDLNEIDEFCMKMNGMMMNMNMPSFSDEMAMREHLKSWAHSVACAVK